MEKKPYSLPLKDFLVELTAKELGTGEDEVYNVINWIYKDTRDATGIYRQIELSGFGKLIVSEAKVKKRLTKINAIKESLEKREEKDINTNKKLATAEQVLEFLNTKMGKNEA